jgi:hypothetical protein
LLNPDYHKIHHTDLVGQYCIISGFLNWPLDHFGFWRGLENIIEKLTGVKPRMNDDPNIVEVYHVYHGITPKQLAADTT